MAYIESEAAINRIHELIKARQEWLSDARGEIQGLNAAMCEIEDMPAADVALVRHGRWISDGPGKRFGTAVRLDKDGCPVDTCHCSECGEWLTASDEYPVIGYYCPNCGAKMDGGTE